MKHRHTKFTHATEVSQTGQTGCHGDPQDFPSGHQTTQHCRVSLNFLLGKVNKLSKGQTMD